MEKFDIPVVQSFLVKDHPKIPSGLKLTCLKSPDSLESSDKCPVVLWNTYTYCAYSYIDNREGMCIVAYSDDKKLARKWEVYGARYIYKIIVDEHANTISFVGQSSRKIVMKWSELYLMIPPLEGRIPTKVHPKIPEGCKATCLKDPNKLDSSSMYPVISMNGLTYWAYSYDDNRVVMNIVAYDDKGNIINQWERSGARYIYDITVDCAEQTVKFYGQGNDFITMLWKELLVKQAQPG